MISAPSEANLLVDTYSDNFGYKLTCSANGWLRRMR
ncbi:MAG: hypothetical protein JWO36_1638 [Myxococcales bacterium]|nr:hypothetical protein [Myxococcales bacterium]